MTFHRASHRPSAIAPEAEVLAFLFRKNELLVPSGAPADIPRWPLSRVLAEGERVRFLGDLDGVSCFAADWPDPALPDGLEGKDLRALFGLLDPALHHVAGLGFHLMHWDRTHSFCGTCGARTTDVKEETAKRCPECGLLAYPRIAPAVIVAVVKDDELLLARGVRYRLPFFSVLAGFVEPGETLEECVQREIREEVGIEVRNIRYFGSQPWPFPDSLMIGFTADYAGGDLVLDPSEIGEAGWYPRDRLPAIPGGFSISRKLIDWFVER